MWIAKENMPRLLELADMIIRRDGEAPLQEFSHLLEQFQNTPKWLRKRWLRESDEETLVGALNRLTERE